MSLRDALIESLRNLRINPLRSILSILGVVFGVASIVAMVGIGMGAEREVERLIASLGARNIHILNKRPDESELSRFADVTIGLSYRDVHLVDALIPEGKRVAIARWNVENVSETVDGSLAVFGVGVDFGELLSVPVIHGRSFTAVEAELGFPVAVIGYEAARRWFGSAEKALNQHLRMERSWFRVIGTLAPAVGRGAAAAGPGQPDAESGTAHLARELELDSGVLVPLAAAQFRLGRKSPFEYMDRLIVQVPATLNPIAVKQRLDKLMQRLHRGSKVYNIVAAEEVIAQKRKATRLFSYFLLTVALISLVVGGTGIANVMLASVAERIKEIGIRRAVGAKKADILTQFLTEAVAICFVGGLVGNGLGWIVALVTATITGWSIIVPWWTVAVALLLASGIGILSGLYPAYAASGISPIEALQGRAE